MHRKNWKVPLPTDNRVHFQRGDEDWEELKGAFHLVLLEVFTHEETY